MATAAQVNSIFTAIQYRATPSDDPNVPTYLAPQTSVTDVVNGVQQAPYTLDVVDAVIRMYQAAFNRIPDQNGASFWSNSVGANPSELNTLALNFSSSAEFKALYGLPASFDPTTFVANGSAQAFQLVTALYTNVLGRPADPAGIAFWANSGVNGAQLLQDFSQSAEFVAAAAPHVIAFQNQEVLGTEVMTAPFPSLFSISPSGIGLILTPNADTPPAYQTDVANATFSAPDVNGVQTLTVGDNLVDTATNSTATLAVVASAAFNHVFGSFTTAGITDLSFQNNLAAGLTSTFDLSGMGANASHIGLQNIDLLSNVTGAPITFNLVPNEVTVNVTGAVGTLAVNYANGVAFGTPQALHLTNATEAPATTITFGGTAPGALAVSLTGSSTAHIIDPALASITVTNTDAGGTEVLTFGDLANNTISSADFSAVKGTLTVTFDTDALAGGSTIKLGAIATTLTIGESNNVGHTADAVGVLGTGGVYHINFGNQNDTVSLGTHLAADTVTFINPNVGAVENVLGTNFVGATPDILQFSIAGFNGGTTSTHVTASLLSLGHPVAPITPTTLQGPGPEVNTLYTGVATAAVAGTNMVLDTANATLAGVEGSLNAAGTPITYTAFGPVAPTAEHGILVAYNGVGGVHVADIVLHTSGAFATTAGHVDVANSHDVAIIGSQTLASVAGHFAFVA